MQTKNVRNFGLFECYKDIGFCAFLDKRSNSASGTLTAECKDVFIATEMNLNEMK